MARREVRIDPGTRVELTSLRTRRKVECRIDGVLGVGGTAAVFAGELSDGTHVVLKSPRYEGEHDAGFEIECELFKHFAHRNIVQSVGVGVTSTGSLLLGFRRAYENPLLLLSRADVDVRDKKARYPSLTLDTAIDLGYELLNGLEYLERLGYVHHDVKLANLMIDVAARERPLESNAVFGKVVRREYRGVLIDFGATRSREFCAAFTEGRAPPGLPPQITPFYAPPEALVESRRKDGKLGLTFDPSLDVYAAAIVLYTMVTGHPPYTHLRTPLDAADIESVIAVKSAERRGEIHPVSLEVIQRVVFEETRFVGEARDAWDLAFHRFLTQRLATDPKQRGTVAQMKRDFEQLMCIRPARGDAQDMDAKGSRVFLPFTQELVKVGSQGEHPLLRAARACGMELSGSGVFQLPAGVKAVASNLDWLDDDADSATAAAAARRREGSHAPKKSPTGRFERPDVARDGERRPGSRDGERPGSRDGQPRPASRPAAPSEPAHRQPTPPPPHRQPTPPPPHRQPTPPPAGPTRGPSPSPVGGPRPRRPEFDETVWGHQTEKRTVVQPGPEVLDPCRRPPPPPAEASAAHVLVSALLDDPLLLSRERKTVIGREQGVDVRIKSDLVSRRHAEISWTGRFFVVADLGSVNGTHVNGVRLTGPCVLKRDDRVSVAGFEIVVKLLTKGVDIEETEGGGTTRIMRPELAQQLGKQSLNGELGQLALKDVLELLEWKKHTGLLTITPPSAPPGRLHIVKGQIHHAETKAGDRGIEAAVTLLRVTAGRFTFEPGPVKVARSIASDNEGIWEQVRAP